MLTIDHLVTLGYVIGRLTSPTSMKGIALETSKFLFRCLLFNKLIISVKIVTFEFQTSLKRP